MSGIRLAVYDMSAYVYTGMRIEKYAKETVRGFPVGGIVYFLRSLCLHLSNNNHVVATFDSRSKKKDVYPQYKSGRQGKSGGPDNYVIAQLEFLQQWLPSIGIPCLKVEGFEADDLIYTTVEQHKEHFVRTTTFSSDIDITHNVDFNVDFEPVNSLVNKVTLNNFKDAVEPTAKVMPNTISAYKAIHGCVSDDIPAFACNIPNAALYKGYCDYLMQQAGGNYPNLAYTRDVRVFAAYVGTLQDQIGPEKFKELVTRAYVTHPLLVPDLNIIPANLVDIQKDKLQRLLCCLREYPSLRTLKMQYSDMTKEEEDLFFSLANKLRTGEFAVDRGLKVSNVPSGLPKAEVLHIREFD